MKRGISAIVAAALVATLSGSAFAGGYARVGYGHGHGHGGFGIGAFFAGLLGGAILTSVIHDSRPAVEYAPPPRPERVWVEGRYETRYDRRWVPGHWEEDRDADEEDGGGRVWVPGGYREAPVRVWVEGHWEERG